MCCIIHSLNTNIYCYNRCKFHDKFYKEKLRNEMEKAGIKFIEYYGKIYMDSFVPQWDYDKNDSDVKALIWLSDIIKDLNDKQKSNRLSLNELKKDGFYFVNIKGWFYLERFNYHELITNAYYNLDNSLPFSIKKPILQKYLEYKKYS